MTEGLAFEPEDEPRDQMQDGVIGVLSAHAEATVTHPDGTEE